VTTFVRLPLLQLGDLVFDAEVSVQRSGERQLSERRLAAGATVADHSRRPPRVFVVEGAVSALAQPQNLGRPNASALDIVTASGLDVQGAFVPLDFAGSRLGDFEARLDSLLDDENYGEVELISKVVGRVRCVLTHWEATTTADDGQSATYRLQLREVQRFDLTIADATDLALELNGQGGAPQPGGGGPSQSTPMTLDITH
jgi:hypothetical protein